MHDENGPAAGLWIASVAVAGSADVVDAVAAATALAAESQARLPLPDPESGAKIRS